MHKYFANNNKLLIMNILYQFPSVQFCDIQQQLFSTMMEEWLDDLIWLKVFLVFVIAFKRPCTTLVPADSCFMQLPIAKSVCCSLYS